MNTTNAHNLKMYILTAIPIIISVLGMVSASYKLPFDAMAVVGILTMIEHAFNGNTSSNVQTSQISVTPINTTSTAPGDILSAVSEDTVL